MNSSIIPLANCKYDDHFSSLSIYEINCVVSSHLILLLLYTVHNGQRFEFTKATPSVVNTSAIMQ